MKIFMRILKEEFNDFKIFLPHLLLIAAILFFCLSGIKLTRDGPFLNSDVQSVLLMGGLTLGLPLLLLVFAMFRDIRRAVRMEKMSIKTRAQLYLQGGLFATFFSAPPKRVSPQLRSGFSMAGTPLAVRESDSELSFRLADKILVVKSRSLSSPAYVSLLGPVSSPALVREAGYLADEVDKVFDSILNAEGRIELS